MLQQMQAIGTKLSETTAYFEPELLQIPDEKIDQFFKEQAEEEKSEMLEPPKEKLDRHRFQISALAKLWS